MMSLKCIVIYTLCFLPSAILSQATFHYNPDLIRSKIKVLVKKIGETKGIDSELTGYAGEKSKQYERFEKLISLASIDELVELLNHPKTTIRGYAFWALAINEYAMLDEVFINHANDVELVLFWEGCLGDQMPLIELMELIITPNTIDSECMKLDPETIQQMKNRQVALKNKKNK